VTRALIVDDQPSFRRRLRQLLTYAGQTIVGEAANAPEAERMVQELAPDLAVVDVMLPGINGLDGARGLLSLAPKLRVILVSIHHDQADVFRTAAAEVGAKAFIPKDELDLPVVREWATPVSSSLT
jgi:DNA-binding NarL/FixJ family response regulator